MIGSLRSDRAAQSARAATENATVRITAVEGQQGVGQEQTDLVTQGVEVGQWGIEMVLAGLMGEPAGRTIGQALRAGRTARFRPTKEVSPFLGRRVEGRPGPDPNAA